MADGDPLMRQGGGGAASGGGGGGGEKRARAFADGATAAEEDNLLLLLDGLSPSPAKKVSQCVDGTRCLSCADGPGGGWTRAQLSGGCCVFRSACVSAAELVCRCRFELWRGWRHQRHRFQKAVALAAVRWPQEATRSFLHAVCAGVSLAGAVGYAVSDSIVSSSTRRWVLSSLNGFLAGREPQLPPCPHRSGYARFNHVSVSHRCCKRPSALPCFGTRVSRAMPLVRPASCPH